MRDHVLVVLAAVCVGCAASPSPELTTPVVQRIAPPIVYTSGVGVLFVPPDLATLTVQFNDSGPTPRQAQRAAAARANEIRAALITVGIQADSMPSVSQWRWWSWWNRNQAQRFVTVVSRNPYVADTGYSVTQTFTARIRDLTMVGPAIDAALDAGANSVTNLQFSRTEIRGPYLEVLDLATRHARENAEVMARAQGRVLGQLMDLSTMPLNASPASGFRLDEIVVSGARGRNTATTIVAPQIRVTTTVYGRWALVP